MVRKRTKNESKGFGATPPTGVYRDLEPDSHPNLGAAQGFLGVFRPVLAHCLQCYSVTRFAFLPTTTRPDVLLSPKVVGGTPLG